MKFRHGVAVSAGMLICALAMAPTASACSMMIDPVIDAPAGSTPAEAQKFRETWSQAYRKQREIERQHAVFTHQSAMLSQAETVLIARIESVPADKPKPSSDWRFPPDMPGIELRPVRWLKGSGPDTGFRIRYDGMTSCGPVPEWDALAGKVGETFVVYVRKGAPAQDTILDIIAPGYIVEPWAKASLTLGQ